MTSELQAALLALVNGAATELPLVLQEQLGYAAFARQVGIATTMILATISLWAANIYRRKEKEVRNRWDDSATIGKNAMLGCALMLSLLLVGFVVELYQITHFPRAYLVEWGVGLMR